MAAITSNRSIETLIQEGDWEAARTGIQLELAGEPDNHWLLTQLGVTFYEQGRYREALVPLSASLKLVPDCPLTLWNVAGALDALGKPEKAVPIYTWLLGSKRTVEDDSCWESAEWTEALKADCLYRIGACFQQMSHPETAELCYREYIDLLLAGVAGIYSIDDAATRIRELHLDGKRKPGKGVRDAIGSALDEAGIPSIRGRAKGPQRSIAELLAT